MNRKLFAVIAIAILLAIPTGSARAQFFFGKNKVQYTNFNWQVMTTEHFKIYFDSNSAEIAAIAARSAEDAYDELRRKFNHEVPRYIPLIIYATPGHFSQTNVIPGMLPESVGGFTEFIKGRVVVPFNGSYHDFNHVIWHEMVHVFQLSKLAQVTSRNAITRFTYPPLWFTEGLAEYWSKDWDTDADIFIKDMVLTERLFTIDRLWQVHGTYFMYKLGESICRYIDTTYGPDKLVRIYDNWDKGESFDEIVSVTLGKDLEELSREWSYALKKHYYPEMDSLGLPDMESKKITDDGFNVKAVPIRWDDGTGFKDWVVYKASRLGYSEICLRPIDGDDAKVKTLVKGERSSAFESLHLLRSGIDACDSGLVVFSSKSKENDVIYIYDLNERKITHRFELPLLIGARSPRISPDMRRIVFTGVLPTGFTDLFLLDLENGTYRALTDDSYVDNEPIFDLDGLSVVFASDRGPDGFNGASNLFRLNLATGEIRQLTFGRYEDTSPEVTERGIFFSSDRGGSFNIVLLEPDGTLTQQSTYVTGAFDPRAASDGSYLTYTGFQAMSFQVYKMDLPEKPRPMYQPLAMNLSRWNPPRIESKYREASIKYDNDYSFDIAQSAIGYDPVYGSIGGFQAAVSDMLGDHAFYFLLTNTATTKDDLLESFNVGVTYINRKNRINWGLGAFHLYDEYYNDFDQYYFERQAGLIGLVSYPISKFHRVDFTTVARYSKRDLRYGRPSREKILASHYVSWVFDNSLWDYTGPIEGRRYNVTVGVTNSLNDLASYNRQVSADLRHYFRLGRYSAFASRLFGFHSTGLEPARIYFGGSWSFRGYDRREWYVRNIVFASHELRFPLIDNLLIGLPIGNLGFSGIRGALFFDVGSAWENEFDQLIGSFGAGMRVALGYFIVLRFDFTRTTDFETISSGTDFDFFFGWNF